MSLGALIGGLGGGLLGLSGSNSAARAQQQAAEAQIMLEGNIFRSTSKKFKPFLESGNRYQQALDYEMGIGSRPVFGAVAPQIEEFTENTGPVQNALVRYPGTEGSFSGGVAAPGGSVTKYRVNGQEFGTREAARKYANANKTGGEEYRGFQETPGYQFQVEEGINAVDSSAASRGTLNSGATLKALQDRGNNLANLEYNNYLNRLTAGANAGQNAAGNFATAGSNFAAGGSNALANFGNAGAAGAIGSSNAIMNGINTGLGIWNYQNQRANSGGGGIFGNFLGGGNSFSGSPFQSGAVY